MNENLSPDRLLEAVKDLSSDDLKSIQRKFSAAHNTIEDVALSRRYRPVFSPREQEALQEASAILARFKRNIEHAKEICARGEKRLSEAWAAATRARHALLDTLLPAPETADEHLECVRFHLALATHHTVISGASFCHDVGHVAEDLRRAQDSKYVTTVVAAARGCWAESRAWLDDNLWHRGETPDPGRIARVLDEYRGTWQARVDRAHADLLAQFEAGLALAFERKEIDQRERDAIMRRARMEVVK